MRTLPQSKRFWDLFKKVESRYWALVKKNPKEKLDMLSLAQAVLDENGMANDPAHDETLRDLCSALGSWNRDQMELFSKDTPSLLVQ